MFHNYGEKDENNPQSGPQYLKVPTYGKWKVKFGKIIPLQKVYDKFFNMS